MQPIAIDGVAWSVCLSVGLSWSSALQKWLSWSRCHFGCGLWWAREPCNRWGSRAHMGRGNFEGKGWPTVRYREYHPRAAVMRPFVKLLLTTCYTDTQIVTYVDGPPVEKPCHWYNVLSHVHSYWTNETRDVRLWTRPQDLRHAPCNLHSATAPLHGRHTTDSVVWSSLLTRTKPTVICPQGKIQE